MNRIALLWISTIFKAAFFLIAIGIAFSITGWNKHFLLLSLVEAGVIYLFGQLFVTKRKTINIIGYTLTSLLSFLFLVNVGSVIFAGSYVTYLMWSNLANVQALGSSLPLYITAVVIALIIAFLPVKALKLPKFGRVIDILLIVISSVLIFATSFQTPLIGWIVLAEEYRQTAESTKALSSRTQKSRNSAYKEFLRNEFTNGIDTGLEHPNVIIIFTEGFSSEIMNINNGDKYPGLTPNLDSFSKQTINFSNYFNHSAATFRGVRGQLNSSQQYLQGYENGVGGIKQMTTTKLDSVQSILADQGYKTEFINAEPHHEIWTTYVKNLGFQKVSTLPDDQLDNEFDNGIVSDQSNYGLLMERAKSLNQSGKPFMLADYTFQTHAGLDSALKYGDGSNSYLNKYHNMDNAFGRFWNAFQTSDLSKNTVLIFTADHAAYSDPTFKKTFDTRRDYFTAPIPLMIWYPGVSGAQTIDVGGRNTLGFAPTVLDLLEARNTENYFLGNSLFSSEVSPLEYVFVAGETWLSTEGMTQQMTKANQYNILPQDSPLVKQIQRYYPISLNF